MPKKKELLLIGRKEDIDLPDLKIKAIDAKVDTGAYSSSIHCHQIKEVVKDGNKVLKFKVLDPEHPNYNRKTFVFKSYKSTKVKSSNGKAEKRFVIKTKVKVYDKSFETEFSLTDRSDMKFPILLGRKFIKQGFLVDVSRYDIASKGRKYKLEIIGNKK